MDYNISGYIQGGVAGVNNMERSRSPVDKKLHGKTSMRKLIR